MARGPKGKWITKAGDQLDIRELDDEHLLNVRKLLRRTTLRVELWRNDPKKLVEIEAEVKRRFLDSICLVEKEDFS